MIPSSCKSDSTLFFCWLWCYPNFLHVQWFLQFYYCELMVLRLSMEILWNLFLKYISQEGICLLPPVACRYLSTQDHFLLNFCLGILLDYSDRVDYDLQTHMNSRRVVKNSQMSLFVSFCFFFIAFRAKSKTDKSLCGVGLSIVCITL